MWWLRWSARCLVIGAGMALVLTAGSAAVSPDLVASAPAGAAHRAPGEAGGAAAERSTVDRAVAEVTAAVVEAGRPPCGNVTVSVAATADGRSWSWPGSCHILLDTTLVDAGGGPFRYVARHEVAHLIKGVNHFDPGFRALEARLAADVGYDLVYGPGAEYPTLVER
ncbi:MAG TPA: hypothetical protein VFE55_11640 [Acidimicrobiia bacterium]|nr:hypothetical protein [Acidimicrobiia bacterium]